MMDSLPKTTKDKILQNTINLTEFYDVAESHNVLPKLHVREYPQLEQVDFYGGHTIPEFDYVPASSQARLELQKNIEESCREHCDLADLLCPRTFVQGQLTFVGPAGSGKSTLLKAIARDVIDGKYEIFKDVDIVHFMQCRHFCRRDIITLGELLFQNMDPYLCDDEIQQTLEFAATNPKRVLFILDSLDTLSFTIDGVYKQLCVTDRASPEAMLWNFLAAKLIPGCRIITSSREHSIRNYMGEVRAHKIIALMGLSMDSVRKIIVGYVGEDETKEIMQYMEHKSPALSELSTTPVFLTFNLIGWKSGGDFKPSTMSGVLVLLLNSLIRSPHAHEENILEVIDKLKELSFNGTNERRVLFSTEEFARLGLKPKTVTDLAILAPGGLTQRLLLGSEVMFFAHQSIQELLTAMYIAQMPREAFHNFLRDKIHTPHYAVVRRILCGLLLDDEVKDQAEQYFQGNMNMEEKQDLLRQSLREQLSEELDKADKLELYLSLSEAKEGMKEAINSSVKMIDLDNIPLSPSDANSVGWVASNCKQLSYLSLKVCHLTPASVKAMASNLRDCDLKMSALYLSSNTNMDVASLKSVGQISEKSKVNALYLEKCDLSPQQLNALKEGLDSAKMSKLKLSSNSNMDVAGLKSVGEISKQSRVETLGLDECDLSPQQLNALKEGLNSAKLSTLDLDKNSSMGEVGLKTVGEISKQCRVEDLSLKDCKLSSRELQTLKEGLDLAKLSTLDLEGNSSMDEAGLKAVGEISKQCRVEDLCLQNCELSSIELQALKEGLNLAKLSTLNLRENAMMGEAGFKIFGEILKQCRVKQLDLSFYNLSPQELEALKEGLDSAELSTLDLKGNTIMGEGSLKAVGEISKQCRVEDLSLEDCELSSRELQALKEGLDLAKLSTLKLWRNTGIGEAGLKTVGEISKQCRVEELNLWDCKLSSQELEALKEGLDSAKISSLELCYNTSMSEAGLKTVGETSKQCRVEKLDLGDCDLSSQELEALKEGLDSAKLSILRLSRNKSMGEAGLKTAGEISNQCRVEELNLFGCNMSSQELEALKEGLDSAKLSTLDLYGNTAMDQACLKTVGEILKQCRVEEIKLQSCELSSQELQALQEGLDSAKISTMQLGVNIKMGEAGLQTVGEISKQCRVEELNLQNCKLSSQELQSLKEGLDLAKLSTLDLYGNTTMDKACLKTVGEILKQCRVEEIKLQGCKLSTQELQGLQEGLDSAKISTMQLGANINMGEAGLQTVGEISKQCRVEELNLQNCKLSSQELQSLKEGLDLAKIQKLVLEDRQKIASHEDTLVLSELIQNVTELLDVNLWEICEEHVDYLQRQLDRCCATQLKIRTSSGVLSTNRQIKAEQGQVTEEELGQEDDEEWESKTDEDEPPTEDMKRGKLKEELKKDSHRKDEMIGPKGGSVATGGCTVSFPPGCLDQDTRVSISLSTVASNWPEGYVAVCPVLQCEPSGTTFSKPFFVKIDTWVSADPSAKCCVNVLYRNAHSMWVKECSVPVDQSREIKFECKHFTPFIIGYLWEKICSLFGPFTYTVNSHLYKNDECHLHLLLCVDNKFVQDEARGYLVNAGFTPTFPIPDKFSVVVGDQISVRLVCNDPPNVAVRDPRGYTVAIDQEFVTNKSDHREFCLKLPDPSDDCILQMTYEVQKVPAGKKKVHPFSYHWTAKSAAVAVEHHHHDNRKFTANTVITDSATAKISSHDSTAIVKVSES